MLTKELSKLPALRLPRSLNRFTPSRQRAVGGQPLEL